MRVENSLFTWRAVLNGWQPLLWPVPLLAVLATRASCLLQRDERTPWLVDDEPGQDVSAEQHQVNARLLRESAGEDPNGELGATCTAWCAATPSSTPRASREAV